MYQKEQWRWNSNTLKFFQLPGKRESPEYQKLAQDSSLENEAPPNRKSYKKDAVRLIVLIFAMALSGICGALLATKAVGTVSTANIANTANMDCGKSSEEARSRGCHYEPLMSSWMHPLCFFEEVADMYDDIFEKWTWFSDSQLTELVSGSEELARLRAGDYQVVFTSARSAHDVHCLYAWRKLNFALQHSHQWMDSRTLEYSHSDHCAAVITDYVSARDSVSLLSKHKSHYQGGSSGPPPGAHLNPNATVWPMLFHACIPLQHF